MKVEVLEDKPIPPPKTVVLTRTEEEATIIRWGLEYLAAIAAGRIADARRAAAKLKQVNNVGAFV